ncbi:MAG: hypothetical protein PHU85_19625, partial [Phycisphaerae bacterium]|nr:hypothetical protein [Phycisphaerae bacterium]
MDFVRVQGGAAISRTLLPSLLFAALAAMVVSSLPAQPAADSTTRPEPAVPATVRADAALPAPATQSAFPGDWHVVKRFDFDEARLGNEGDVPMYWFRFKGQDYPDFPRFATGTWDRTFGFNSKQSFRLSLDGGNVGFYYQTNTVAIMPGQDVRVEAKVRTSLLQHARAVIEVSFNDARGEIVPGSRRTSPLLGGPGQNDRWLAVAVNVPGKFPSARYVNLSIFLLQPSRWRTLDPVLRDQPNLVDYIDVRGHAWFDDITIYRLPRVSMTSGHPGQLIPATSRPAIDVNVEGFANQPLEAVLSVRDAAGRLIGHEVFESPGSDRPTRSFKWTTTPLPAAIYHAELSLFAGGSRLVGLPPLLTRQLTFAQLAPTPSRAGRGRGFGIALAGPPAGLDEAAVRTLAAEQADAIGALPVTLVKLPLWRADLRLDSLDRGDPWTDEIVRRIIRQRLALVGVFGQIPGPLLAAAQSAADPAGARLGLRRSLLDVLSGNTAAWRPYVTSQLARYAEQIRYWQIGQEEDIAFALDPRFAATLESVRKEFRTLLTSPTFVVTWPATYSYRKPAGNDEPADGSPAADMGKEKFPAQVVNLFLSNRA